MIFIIHNPWGRATKPTTPGWGEPGERPGRGLAVYSNAETEVRSMLQALRLFISTYATRRASGAAIKGLRPPEHHAGHSIQTKHIPLSQTSNKRNIHVRA